MSILAINGEEIKLDDLILPGALQKMTIDGQAIVDKQDAIVGTRTTQHAGFQPKTLVIEMALFATETADVWRQVEELERAFSYNKAAFPDRPSHYRIVSPHTKARRLKQVSFTGLRTDETSHNDLVMVALSFDEFNPVDAKPADTPAQPAAATATSAPAKKPTDGIKQEAPAVAGFQAAQQ